MQESEFHRLADLWLATAGDALEAADGQGLLDAEYEAGALNLKLPSGKIFIVSKHAPTRQLWLSSPISGGLHFSWREADKKWALDDGRALSDVLSKELLNLGNIHVAL